MGSSLKRDDVLWNNAESELSELRVRMAQLRNENSQIAMRIIEARCNLDRMHNQFLELPFVGNRSEDPELLAKQTLEARQLNSEMHGILCQLRDLNEQRRAKSSEMRSVNNRMRELESIMSRLLEQE